MFKITPKHYHVVHTSISYNGKKKFIVKFHAPTKPECVKWKKDFYKKYPGCGAYVVVSAKELEQMVQDLNGERKQKAKEKRERVKARHEANGTKPEKHFILCPQCKAKSKKLYSEFGGLVTRQCQNGHRFEYDKWIAGLAPWAAIFNPLAVPLVEDAITKMV